MGGHGRAVMRTSCPNQNVPRPESVAGGFKCPGVADEIALRRERSKGALLADPPDLDCPDEQAAVVEEPLAAGSRAGDETVAGSPVVGHSEVLLGVSREPGLLSCSRRYVRMSKESIMSLLHASRTGAVVAIWMANDVPTRLVHDGVRYRVTDTPTRLEDANPDVAYRLNLTGWRFQGTNESGLSPCLTCGWPIGSGVWFGYMTERVRWGNAPTNCRRLAKLIRFDGGGGDQGGWY
jgi:hypothetical protein